MTFTCYNCGIEKDIKQFYKINSARGHRTTCKYCENEKRKNRLTIPKKERTYTKNEYLKCYECNIMKPRNDFKFYTEKARSKKCSKCALDTKEDRKFNLWYNRNIKTPKIQKFLKNLREVTGINNPEDLLKKYNILD